MSRVEDLTRVTLREPFQSSLDRLKTEGALKTIKRALSLEPLATAPIKRILDFGCGYGDPTLALVTVANAIGATVYANDDGSLPMVVRRGIIPVDHFIPGNGIEHLFEVGEKRLPKYDLITGMLFGPDRIGGLFRLLALASIQAVNPTGHILLTSDTQTIDAALKWCGDTGMTYFLHPYDPVNGIPRTLVIPQNQCEKMSFTVGLM